VSILKVAKNVENVHLDACEDDPPNSPIPQRNTVK
jgi:hypothetical protein